MTWHVCSDIAWHLLRHVRLSIDQQLPAPYLPVYRLPGQKWGEKNAERERRGKGQGKSSGKERRGPLFFPQALLGSLRSLILFRPAPLSLGAHSQANTLQTTHLNIHKLKLTYGPQTERLYLINYRRDAAYYIHVGNLNNWTSDDPTMTKSCDCIWYSLNHIYYVD